MTTSLGIHYNIMDPLQRIFVKNTSKTPIPEDISDVDGNKLKTQEGKGIFGGGRGAWGPVFHVKLHFCGVLKISLKGSRFYPIPQCASMISDLSSPHLGFRDCLVVQVAKVCDAHVGIIAPPEGQGRHARLVDGVRAAGQAVVAVVVRGVVHFGQKIEAFPRIANRR